MDQYIYQNFSGSKICSLILHVDDILLGTNDRGLMHEVKQFLFNHFDMKDMGDASYVISIKILATDIMLFEVCHKKPISIEFWRDLG